MRIVPSNAHSAWQGARTDPPRSVQAFALKKKEKKRKRGYMTLVVRYAYILQRGECIEYVLRLTHMHVALPNARVEQKMDKK